MGPGGHGNKALDSIHVGFRMSLPELAVPVGPERASMRKLSLCVLPWTRLVVRVSGRFSGVFCLGKQLESPGGRRDYKPGAHPWGPVRAHRGWTAVIGGNSCGFSLSLLLEFHPFMAVIPGMAFAAAKGIGAAVLARRGHKEKLRRIIFWKPNPKVKVKYKNEEKTLPCLTQTGESFSSFLKT